MKYYYSWLNLRETFFFTHIPKIEVYGVLWWYKQVGYIGLGKESDKIYPLFSRFLEKHDLKYMMTRKSDGSIEVHYSKHQKYIDTPYNNHWDILSYPDCCIIRQENTLKMELFNGNIIYDIYQRTPQKELFPYYNNFIFTCATRQYPWPLDSKVFSHGALFISHTPHSFDCQKSQDLWKINEKILKKFEPKAYEIILEKTRKNYFFFSPLNWIALDYRLTWKNRLRIFEGVFKDPELERIFDKANYTDFNGKELKIFQDASLIATFQKEKDFLPLWFKSV